MSTPAPRPPVRQELAPRWRSFEVEVEVPAPSPPSPPPEDPEAGSGEVAPPKRTARRTKAAERAAPALLEERAPRRKVRRRRRALAAGSGDEIRSTVAAFAASCAEAGREVDPVAVEERLRYVLRHVPTSRDPLQTVVLVSKDAPPYFGVTSRRGGGTVTVEESLP